MTEEPVFGTLYSADDDALWSSLVIPRQVVMEVKDLVLPGEETEEGWTAFWVTDVRVGASLGIELEAKFVGTAVKSLATKLSSLFNRRVGILHLCPTYPCPMDTPGVHGHVNKFRLIQVEEFEADYVSAHGQRQLKKSSGLDEEDDAEADGPPGGETSDGGIRRPALRPARAAVPKAGASLGKDVAAKEEDAPRRVGVGTPPLETISREELRRKLEKSRQRILGEKHRDGGAGRAAVRSNQPLEVHSSDSASPGYSASVLDDALVPGIELPPAQEERKQRVGREKRRSRSKKASGRPSKEGLLAIKDGTMTTLQSQLVQRASESAHKMRKRKKEKDKKESSSKGLLKILTKAMKGKKEDSKKRKRKKKRLKEEGGSPGGGSDDSGTGSSGSSYTASSSESSGEAEKDLDPPLRKRSKTKPGSVLQMLVNHARAQLDTTSKVSAKEEDNPTMGVRIASYFSIVIRPHLTGSMNQQREMHHLSNAIDLLRQGQLDRLGDLLASRFISIHQSLIDGNWSSARFLEIMPMEEMSAADSSVVLSARKHAKLNAKVTNPDLSNTWRGPAKGKGKNKWSTWHESEGTAEGKGKGKKGGKGKGKPRSSWTSAWQGDADPEQGKKKEKPQDK